MRTYSDPAQTINMLTALRCSPLSHLGRRVWCASVDFSAVRSAVSPIFLHSQCRQRGAHSSAPAAASAAQAKFSDAETSSAGPASLPLAAFYSLCDVALNSIQNRLEMPDLDIPTFESELTVRTAYRERSLFHFWFAQRHNKSALF